MGLETFFYAMKPGVVIAGLHGSSLALGLQSGGSFFCFYFWVFCCCWWGWGWEVLFLLFVWVVLRGGGGGGPARGYKVPDSLELLIFLPPPSEY